MDQEEPQINVRLPPKLYIGLKRYALRRNVGVSDAVERILMETIRTELNTQERKQVQAEAEVIAFVDETVNRIRDQGNWDEHVTGRVFREIRDNILSIYQKAIECDPFTFGNWDKARLNKRIGRRIRQLLGADVVKVKGKRGKGQPSLTEKSLILSYTLLKRGA